MSTTGHESEAINVQGLKASLQKLKTDHIDGKADKATTLAGYGITDAYTKTEVNGLVDTPHQEYVTVDAYANLPAEGSADTIYRVSNWDGSANSGAGAVDATVYSEYAWDDVSDPNKYVFLCVKSQIGEVFDISVYNNNAKYADLAAALNGGANIPQSLQKGGMSVKFVQSSDNKYVQFRLMSDTFSTTVTNWQGVDNEPTAGSDNLVKSGGVKTYVDDIILPIASGVDDLHFSWINGRYTQNTFVPDASRSVTTDSIIKGANQVVYVAFGASLPVASTFYVAIVNADGSFISLTSYSSSDYTEGFDVVLEKGKYYRFSFYASSGTMNSSVMNASQDTYINFDIDVLAGLKEMIDSGYLYKGIATLSTTPSTPKTKEMYVAIDGGTYTNFGNLEVPQGINIIKWNGSSWSVEQIVAIDDIPINGNQGLVRSNGVALYNNIIGLTPFNIVWTNNKYYKSDLGEIRNNDYHCGLIALDNTIKLLLLLIHHTGTACTTLTDENDNVLWQVGTGYDGIVWIDLEQYPTAKKLYYSSLKSDNGYVSYVKTGVPNPSYYEYWKQIQAAKWIASTFSLTANGNISITIEANIPFELNVDKGCSIFYFSDGVRYDLERGASAGVHYYQLPRRVDMLRFTDFTPNLSISIRCVSFPLSDSYSLNSRTTAASAKGLKDAYDALNNRIEGNKLAYFVDNKSCFEDSLAKYIKSYRLMQQLQTPYVDRKLEEKDALVNSAGKTSYYDGYVYVTKYQNHLASGNGESEYIDLAKVSVSDPTDITSIIAFDVDEVLTFADSSSITIVKALEAVFIVDENGIKIVSLIQYSDSGVNKYQLVYKLFNLSLVQQGNAQKCTLKQGETTYNFEFSSLPSTIMSQSDKVPAVFNSGLTVNDGVYYGIFGFNLGTFVWILSSTDLINWETKINIGALLGEIGYIAYGETAITPITQFEVKKYLIASRTFNGPTILSVIDSNFENIESNVVIKGGNTGSMPSFFKIGTQLYGLICGTDSVNGVHRYHYKIMKICERNIIDSEVICDTNGVRLGPNTIISVDANNNLYGCVTGVNLILCKFTLPTLTNAQCDSVLEKILALQ